MFGLYVGNLTWWTTDKDVIEAINSIGVQDVQEVKFFENRNNGQSKGFCLVTFATDASLPIVLEKLPKLDLHGQKPVVTSYNRQNLDIFESQTNKTQRPLGAQTGQLNSTNGSAGPQHTAGIMGINSITGVHAAAAAAAAAAGQLPPFGGGLTNAAGGYNNHVGSGPRPLYQTRMRGPRPVMRGTGPGSMNNGSMMPGGPRLPRYMQPQWQNSPQPNAGYAPRMAPTNMSDISNRLGGGPGIKDDLSQGGDMHQGSSHTSSNYYTTHHSSSSNHPHHHQSEQYGSSSDQQQSSSRDLRSSSDGGRGSGRDYRDDRDSSSRRLDSSRDRSSRLDDKGGSLRHSDDRSRGGDDRHSSRQDDRSERSSKRTSDGRTSSSRRNDMDHESRSSRREEGGSSSSHRRDRDRSSKREERSSRRDRDRERSEHSKRSRSRSREKDKSRRDRDRRERY